MSILSFLNPFAKTVASDLDAEVASIQSKANADIAAAKLKHTQLAAITALQAKQTNWAQFQADYEAYLKSLPVNPSPAPTGPTGPTGAH